MASAGLAAALDKTPPAASISPKPASGDGAVGVAAETGGAGAAPQVVAEVKEAILPWHKSVKLTKAILEAGTPSSKHGNTCLMWYKSGTFLSRERFCTSTYSCLLAISAY